MATYVISDIHGEYDMFLDLLQKIELKDEDDLYILGDVIDRGPHPVKTLQKLMSMPNAYCILGNHEMMALSCLKFLMQEITEDSIKKLDEEMLGSIYEWQMNGADPTIRELYLLSQEEKEDVLDFLKEFLLYEEVTAGGEEYLLVHAGLGNYLPEKALDDYEIEDLIWPRAEYDIEYFPDRYAVTGHTPTQIIPENPRPGYIYRANRHIAIDCGAHIPGGRLAAICLETGEEFYSYTHEPEED